VAETLAIDRALRIGICSVEAMGSSAKRLPASEYLQYRFKL
jgi:hypothetical protein